MALVIVLGLTWVFAGSGCFLFGKKNPNASPTRKEQAKINEDKANAAIKKFRAAKCDTAAKLYQKANTAISKVFSREYPPKKGNAFFLEGGVKIAKCGDWDNMITALSWAYNRGKKQKLGAKLLTKAAEAGVEVEKSFLAYLGEKKGDAFAASGGLGGLRGFWDWKEQTGGKCDPYVPFAGGLKNFSVRVEFGLYFIRVGCKAALPLFEKDLAHTTPALRVHACRGIGKVGTKAHLEKVTLLANNDPASQIVRGVRVYFVRDACRQAVNQLKLR